jgi:hypothetical protein
MIAAVLSASLVAAGAAPRSPVIYPEQEIALRFDHGQHLDKKIRCGQCHFRIAESDQASDRNIPTEGRCAICHEIEEAKAGAVVDPPSACRDCHPGFDPDLHRAPRPSRFPAPMIQFSHARHLGRGAECADCHDMARVQLATREQLPRMADCLVCHDGARAPAGCATCHLPSRRAHGATIETELSTGQLRPGPGNPYGLDHGPRFERTHAGIASRQREQCLACHAENSCNRCHDGAGRPLGVHPPDFATTHPVAARQGEPRCDACHRRQSFCAACHERTGVGSNAPAFRDAAARVHPQTWLTPGPGHHAIQAARNIASCASCHREEQCLECHATTGVKPHPPGFAAGCRQMIRKNDRACAKCHDLSNPADAAARCR